MSSWDKIAKAGKKTHRERHQPKSRKHLGILEKKNDYKSRADDYNEKKNTLKLLKRRALNKNPDEFYFHMINSKIKRGVHTEKEKKEEYTEDQIKLMETQDQNYINFKKHLESRSIEKLQHRLQAIDAANDVVNKHIFFVDDDEAKNFDVVKKLETHKDLLNRKTNRLKLNKLNEIKMPAIDEQSLMKIAKQKQASYAELQNRIKREKELAIMQQKLEVRKALKDKTIKKPKMIKEGTTTSAPLYKWHFQRKK